VAKKGKKRESSKLVKKLRKHYRLVVMNDENFEIRTSIKLTPMNVIFIVSSISVMFIAVIVLLLVFTPLRQYIPGYEYKEYMNQELLTLKKETDSLREVTDRQSWNINNIRHIITGNVDTTLGGYQHREGGYDSLMLGSESAEDSLLRVEMEQEGTPGLQSTTEVSRDKTLEEENFFPPVHGIVTNHFNPEMHHYGVDLVAEKNTPVQSVLPGRVIFEGWTLDDGYIVAIQHRNNLVSIYKHNAVVLKKVGNFVHAGDVIATVGNSGELSQGTHLHFELWYNLKPTDPEMYITLH